MSKLRQFTTKHEGLIVLGVAIVAVNVVTTIAVRLVHTAIDAAMDFAA